MMPTSRLAADMGLACGELTVAEALLLADHLGGRWCPLCLQKKTAGNSFAFPAVLPMILWP